MLNFKKYFINRVINDSQLSVIIKNGTLYNVYPDGVDVSPENFPAITIKDVGGVVLSVPRGMHINIMQVDIWSTKNDMEVETIHEHLGRLFNFRDSTQDTTTGTLWWVRENGVRDLSDSSRRIWHKQVDLKYWMTNPDAD